MSRDMPATTAMGILLLAIAAMLAVSAHCQIQPELVSSQSYAAYLDQMIPSASALAEQMQSHILAELHPDAPSFTRTEKAAIAVNAGFRIADATQTCIALHNGGYERWMTQSCGVNAALILGGIPAQYFGMKLAKRAGHPWMSKIVEWGLPLGSAYAIAYSTYHWDDPKRRKP